MKTHISYLLSKFIHKKSKISMSCFVITNLSSYSKISQKHYFPICYVGRKSLCRPFFSNTDLQAANVTVKWIVLLGSRDHEYLIHRVFKRNSDCIQFWFWIQYQVFWYSVLYTSDEIVLSNLLERIISRALLCIIWRIRLVRWLYMKMQEYYYSLNLSYEVPFRITLSKWQGRFRLN